MGEVGRCLNCGGPTRMGVRGVPRKFCDKPECARARKGHAGRVNAERLRRRRRAIKTKVCVLCGVRKPLTDEHFYIKREDGEVVRVGSYCRPCGRVDQVERYAASPVIKAKAQQRALAQRDRNRRRAAADAEFAAAQRERWRRYQTERVRTTDERPEDPPMPRLPAKPVADFIERLVAADPEDGSREMICEHLGFSERSLFAWRMGERPTVQFDLVDRLLIESGKLWFDIYDEDRYPEEHRIAELVFDPPLEEAA